MAKAEATGNKLRWEWHVENKYGGLTAPKAIWMKTFIGNSLGAIDRAAGAEVASRVESLLPVVLEASRNIGTEISGLIKGASIDQLTAAVKEIKNTNGKTILQLGVKETDLSEFLAVMVESLSSGKYSNLGKDRQDADRTSPALGGFLNSLRGANGLQAVTDGGFILPIPSDKAREPYMLQSSRGLVAPVARDNIVPFLAAVAGTVIFTKIGVDSSIRGAGDGVEPNLAAMLAWGIFCTESWATHQLAKVVKGEHLAQLSNDIITWAMIAAIGLVVVGSYVYDLTTTYAGLAAMGVTNELIHVIGTAAASLLPEVLLSYVIAETLDYLKAHPLFRRH